MIHFEPLEFEPTDITPEKNPEIFYPLNYLTIPNVKITQLIDPYILQNHCHIEFIWFFKYKTEQIRIPKTYKLYPLKEIVNKNLFTEIITKGIEESFEKLRKEYNEILEYDNDIMQKNIEVFVDGSF